MPALLAPIGRSFVQKPRPTHHPNGVIHAELWLYPNNSMILELSTKCAPSETFQVAAEAQAFLTERGVDLAGEQETKTKRALEFFSERLQAPSD